MAVGDQAVAAWVEAHAPYLDVIVPIAGALLVVGFGRLLAGRKSRALAERTTVRAQHADVRPGHAA
jgi:hypothetical protein